MLRSIATVLALAAALPALGESLNHTTGTQGLLLIDKLGGHVRFFDPTSLAERSSLELPKNPHDFALSADHRFAYVPIYGPGIYNRNPEPGHELYVLDLGERKVANVIDLSPYRSPHGVQIDARGMLYVTAELDRKILVIDGQAGPHRRHDRSRRLGPLARRAARRQQSLRREQGRQAVRHACSISPRASRSAPCRCRAARRASRRRRTASASSRWTSRGPRSRSSTRRPTQCSTASRSRTRRTPAYKAYYSPDGKWLLTMAGSSISIFDAANLRAPQRTLKVGASPMGIGFSADGKTALVANHGDGTVSVVDIATATVTKTFKAGTGIETLTYY